MKLTKIDLKPYKIKVNIQSRIMQKILRTVGVISLLRESDSWTQNEVESLVNSRQMEQDYAVKESIINILFAPQLKLSGQEIYEREKLADKISEAKDEVLLEKKDYETIKNAFSQFRGMGFNERELLRRIFEAEEVEVEEKKKKEK